MQDEVKAGNGNKIVELSREVDSLGIAIEARDTLLANIRLAILGETYKAYADSGNEDALNIDSLMSTLNSPSDSALRADFEGLDADTSLSVLVENKLKQMQMHIPLKGTISKRFNPDEGHLALDITAAKGSSIYSILNGRVIFADDCQEGGKTLIIQHSAQLVSIYKHSSKLLCKLGDKIEKGEKVAVIGGTGEQSSGPHLHLEIWHETKAVNPLLVMEF